MKGAYVGKWVQMAVASVCAALVMCHPAWAEQRWFMYTLRFQGGTDFTQCLADTFKAANNVMSRMSSQGYPKGALLQGRKSVRVDGIGDKSTSIYLFCTDYSIYVLTGHCSTCDGDLFDKLYNAVIDQFPKG
jgi:hypothetical protein